MKSRVENGTPNLPSCFVSIGHQTEAHESLFVRKTNFVIEFGIFSEILANEYFLKKNGIFQKLENFTPKINEKITFIEFGSLVTTIMSPKN